MSELVQTPRLEAAEMPIVGTTFGGDGEISFALPDLRTRIVVGG